MALIAAVAAAASAEAGSGGTSTGGGCATADFGERSLRLGDCGSDVKVLNCVMKSKSFGGRVPLDKEFADPTDGAVRTFQERKDLRADGVVGARTRKQLKRSMNRDVASWYGPGFWGNRTACGKRLRHDTIGVAHRDLPCGTKVTFAAHGQWLRTKVIDRGPYSRGIKWDLTRKAARKLNLEVTENVRAAAIK
jgi:rare lipoprotein A (peptidoglycan hydrolase)